MDFALVAYFNSRGQLENKQLVLERACGLLDCVQNYFSSFDLMIFILNLTYKI
jgi:hypothetical protein